MNAAIVNTVVPRAARIDAPAKATAKTPDDGRFGETLKAGVAVEAPVATTPATSATPGVGKVPVAMTRPPDVSSPEDAVARTATKAHEPQQEETSQDTGAVSVAKDDHESPGAAEAGAAPQQSARPLVAIAVGQPMNGKAQASGRDNVKPDAIAKKAESKSDAAKSTAASNCGQAIAQDSATVVPVVPAPVAVDAKIQPRLEAEPAPVAVKDSKDGIAGAKTSGAALKKTDSKPVAAAGSAVSATANASIPVVPEVSVAAPATSHIVGATGVTPIQHVAHTPLTSTTSATTKIAGSSALSSTAAGVASAPNTDLRTLVSTPNVLEIGFASGSHGWLRVRAELDGTGEVAASVVAASVGAAEGLHKELPGLSQYLEGEHVALSSLVVNASGKGAEAQDAATSAGSNEASAGGRQGADQGKSSAQARTDVASVREWTGVESVWQGMQLPAAMLANGSGSWLSVRV